MLACKQAAFVQNPDYPGAGSGLDIITVGHNPYFPNMGKTCAHVVLPSTNRKRFVDEYIYERLFLATKPFCGGILQSLSKKYRLHGLFDQRRRVRQRQFRELKALLMERDLEGIEATEERYLLLAESHDRLAMEDLRGIPYGSHHIDPSPRGRALLGDFLLSIPKDLYPVLRKRMVADPGSDKSGGRRRASKTSDASGELMKSAAEAAQPASKRRLSKEKAPIGETIPGP